MVQELKIFSGRANPDLSQKICEFLNLQLGDCSLITFPDSEFHCKIEDVRGRDVSVTLHRVALDRRELARAARASANPMADELAAAYV